MRTERFTGALGTQLTSIRLHTRSGAVHFLAPYLAKKGLPVLRGFTRALKAKGYAGMSVNEIPVHTTVLMKYLYMPYR